MLLVSPLSEWIKTFKEVQLKVETSGKYKKTQALKEAMKSVYSKHIYTLVINAFLAGVESEHKRQSNLPHLLAGEYAEQIEKGLLNETQDLPRVR